MGKRIGRQEPTVWSTLPYTHTEGEAVVAAYEATGQSVMEWQKKQINAILAVDDEGKYIHRRYGLSISRRNGKTEVFLMRELYALRKGERVLHTAHQTATSNDASQRLAEALTRMGYEEVVKKKKEEIYDHHFVYRKQFGMEVIELLCEGGGKVSFRTRTSRGGLGQKCDVLIIDEAQEYLLNKKTHSSSLYQTVKTDRFLCVEHRQQRYHKELYSRTLEKQFWKAIQSMMDGRSGQFHQRQTHTTLICGMNAIQVWVLYLMKMQLNLKLVLMI